MADVTTKITTDIISVDDLFKNRDKYLVFDTRSPKEYDESHIPGAISCPLLDNIERHVVGICYKQEGHDKATKLGYEFFFKKFDDFCSQILEFKRKTVVIQCARGGMRSRIVVDLFQNKNRILETIKRVGAEIDLKEFEKRLNKLDKINI